MKIVQLVFHPLQFRTLAERRIYEADRPLGALAVIHLGQSVEEVVGVWNLEVLLCVISSSSGMHVILREEQVLGSELGKQLKLPLHVRLLAADEEGGVLDGIDYLGWRVRTVEKLVGHDLCEFFLGRPVGTLARVLHLLLLQQEVLSIEDAFHEGDGHQRILNGRHHEVVANQGLVEGLLVWHEVRCLPLADGVGLIGVHAGVLAGTGQIRFDSILLMLENRVVGRTITNPNLAAASRSGTAGST